MLGLMGGNAGKVQEALEALPELLERAPELLYRLECGVEAQEATYRILSYEYGRANPDFLGPNLDGEEFIGNVRTSSTEPDQDSRMDFAALLGRPAVRGTIENIGDEMAALWFLRESDKAETPTRIGPYYLPPNAARAISRFTGAVEVAAVEDGAEVWVQADVQ